MSSRPRRCRPGRGVRVQRRTAVEGEKARGLGDMPRVLLGERGTLSGGRCIEPGDAVVSSSSRITLPIGHLGASSPAIARSKAQEKPKPGRGQSSRSNPEAERAPNPGERVDLSGFGNRLVLGTRPSGRRVAGLWPRQAPLPRRLMRPGNRWSTSTPLHRRLSKRTHLAFRQFLLGSFSVVCQQAGRQRKK